jgi:hypothetical protein
MKSFLSGWVGQATELLEVPDRKQIYTVSLFRSDYSLNSTSFQLAITVYCRGSPGRV